VLHVGTCGWHYDDWINVFYPAYLRSKKDKWLGYYSERFDTVEIDSTFYNFPTERTVSFWLGKISTIQKKGRTFTFSLKIPKNITHDYLLNGMLDTAIETTRKFEQKVVSKLHQNNCLSSVLIQLSPYFKSDKIDILEKYLSAIDHSKYDYTIEFRNTSWLGVDKNFKKDTLNLLSRYNIANCITDGPTSPNTTTSTANHAYIRFHGRNYDIWFKKEITPTDSRINRYDYLYSDEELKPWVDTIKKINSSSKETRIYFNNHPHGNAIKNAHSIKSMLELKTISLSSTFQPQLF